MALNYVASAHPPTAVLGVERATFTGPDHENLILVKATRLEVHRLTDEGLELVLDEPINGEVQVLQVLRLPGEARDVLFLVTRARQFCLLGYSQQWGCLMTREQGSVRDRIGKEVEGGPIGVADPQGRVLGLHLCEGLFKVLCLEGTGRLAKVTNLRLAEVEVADLCFLHGYPKPTLALLCEDATFARKSLVTYTIDPAHPQMTPGPLELKALPPLTHLLLPVPPPLYGLLLVAQDVILYRSRSSKQLTQVAMPVTSITTAAPLRGDAGDDVRFLLGDCYGRIYLLLLRPDTSTECGVTLHFDLLGETCIPSSIAYLGSGIAFLGSSGGDSQILRFIEGGGLEVLDVYENLGPISDMCVVDLDRQGQGQLVTCSGVHRDGSLRVVRNGIGIAEQAALPLAGVLGLFSLRQQSGGAFDEVLVMSFLNETKCLRMAGDEMAEVDLGWKAGAGLRTLWAGNIGGAWVRVTPQGVERAGAEGIGWSPGVAKRVTVAQGWDGGVVLAVEGGEVVHLGGDGDLEEVARLQLDHEVSCLGVGHLPQDSAEAMDLEESDGSGASMGLVAIGLWEENSVRLVKLPSLVEWHRQELGLDVQPRSLALARLGQANQLLVALGDGQLLTWELHLAGDACHTVVGKRLRLGVQPLALTRFTTSEGTTAVFAASDKPCVLFGDQQRLLCANVNAGEVQTMCPFHAESVPHGIALASADGLRLGTIDHVQRLHVQTVPLLEQPRKIAHSPQHRLFCVATERPGGPQADGSFSDFETGFLRFLDDSTFDPLAPTPHLQLDPNEALMALCCVSLGDGVEVFAAGTGYEDVDAIEPDQGRILIVAVTGVGPARRAELRCELGVRGCVYALLGLGDKLLCAVNSEVHLYSLEKVGGLEGEVGLVKECGIKSHVLVVDLSAAGDFIAVGDLMRSVTMLRYMPGAAGKKGRLEEVAHDYAPAWTTQVHLTDDEFCLTAENSNNLYTVRRDAEAASDEDRSRLQLHGEYHLGELVNKMVPGSLVMRTGDTSPDSAGRGEAKGDGSDASAAQKKPEKDAFNTEVTVTHSLLFGTVSGAVGVILGLEKCDYDFFRTLQGCMAEVVNHVGRLPHDKWRDFLSTHHAGGNSNFIDGDLVERFVELRPEDREKVVRAMRESNFYKETLTAAWESQAADGPSNAAPEDRPGQLTVDFVLRKVQEAMRYH